jgi:hypothetical protein
MALKNFGKLNTRRQGELVGELHRLICSYPFFPVRSRVSLREHLKNGDYVYWLEDRKSGQVQAMTLIDKPFLIEGLSFTNIGFMISKNPNQLNEVFNQAYTDHKDSSLIIITKEIIASSVGLEEKGFKVFAADLLMDKLPKLGKMETDYYGIKSSLSDGMHRRNDFCYIKAGDDVLSGLG